MIEFFEWLMLACGALSAVNTYRHASNKLPASYWGGASAAGQACLSGGCLAMAAVGEFAPGGSSPLRWAIVALGVALFWLGLWIEKREVGQAARHALEADGAPSRQ